VQDIYIDLEKKVWVSVIVQGSGYLFSITRLIYEVNKLDHDYLHFAIYVSLLTGLLIGLKIYAKHKHCRQTGIQLSALEEYIAIMKTIVDNVPAGIYVTDAEKIVYHNKELADIVGHKNEDEANNRIICLWGNISEPTVHFNGREYQHSIKSISNTYQLHVITDITEAQIKNSKQIENTKWKKLMLCLSHEFRTPLNWLIGSFSLITVHSESKEVFEMAKAATHQILFYLNSLISFNSININEYVVTPKNFSLAKVISRCITINELECKMSHNKCSYSIAFNDGRVNTDKQMYTQILSNILLNSFQSTKKGSISIWAESKDGYLYTYVKDNGRGLNNQEIKELLDNSNLNDPNILTITNGLSIRFCKIFCKALGGGIKISVQNRKYQRKVSKHYII
jgi:sensor histidine kinase regulating citrate/malate metabolism